MNLLSLVPLPYRVLALAVMAVALMGFGWVKGAEHGETKLNAYIAVQDKAILAQVQKAAQTTANLQSDASVLEEVKNAEIKTINGRLSVALADSVRIRSERRPDLPQISAACAGSTGKELARGDADFLDRYASDAARLQAALGQCKAQYDAAFQALK